MKLNKYIIDFLFWFDMNYLNRNVYIVISSNSNFDNYSENIIGVFPNLLRANCVVAVMNESYEKYKKKAPHGIIHLYSDEYMNLTEEEQEKIKDYWFDNPFFQEWNGCKIMKIRFDRTHIRN